MPPRVAVPPWRNVLLAAGLGAVSVLGATLAEPGGRPLWPTGALLVTAAVAALCWRVRFPVPVLAVVTALVAVYYWLDHPDGPASVLVAAAVYTVASRVRWPRAVAAGVLVVLAWAGTEQFLREGPPRPWADHYGWIVVTVAVGVAVGAARRAAEASADRAEERLRRRVEQERLRIARDVHDVVSHSLSMIVVQAGVGAHVAARRPDEALAALERIRDAGGEALRELRTTLRVLRADDRDGAHDGGPDGGGGEAPGLDRLDEVVRAARAGGLAVVVGPVAGDLPPEVDRVAFAVVREAVTNTVRHAPDATTCDVGLERTPGGLRIRVTDDGGPPAPAAGRDRAGQGLRGLVERAGALGGTVRSGPGGDGFVVEAVLPLPDDRRGAGGRHVGAARTRPGRGTTR